VDEKVSRGRTAIIDMSVSHDVFSKYSGHKVGKGIPSGLSKLVLKVMAITESQRGTGGKNHVISSRF